MLVLPSPKSHSQEVPGPSEVLLNWTVKGALPLETSAVKDATGGGLRVGVGAGVGIGVTVGRKKLKSVSGARLGGKEGSG